MSNPGLSTTTQIKTDISPTAAELVQRRSLSSWPPGSIGSTFQEKRVRAKVPVKLGSLPCPPLIAPLPPSGTAPTWCLPWMAHFNSWRTRKAGLNWQAGSSLDCAATVGNVFGSVNLVTQCGVLSRSPAAAEGAVPYLARA
jgi:hypothetical protein